MIIVMNKSRTDRINDFQAYVDLCGLYRIIDADVFAKINSLGYFDAPASTKYHLAYEGGLYEHSRNVADTLMKFTTDNGLCWQRSQSPYIVGFFHDLCNLFVSMTHTDLFGIYLYSALSGYLDYRF